MRILAGAAVAALMLATPGLAQTEQAPAAAALSACAVIPPAPTDLPDGARASRRQMESANGRVAAWAAIANASLQCRRAEAEALRVQADALGADFNTQADAVRATITGWEAEAVEFNARPEREPRRQQEQPQMPQPQPPPGQ